MPFQINVLFKTILFFLPIQFGNLISFSIRLSVVFDIAMVYSISNTFKAQHIV